MRHILPLALLIFITIVLFANTLENSFVWDDRYLIVDNIYLRSLENIPYFFTPGYWKEFHSDYGHGVLDERVDYRPISVATFALDYNLWKLRPVGYHLTNTLLHLLNVIMVYFLVLRLAAIGGPVSGSGTREFSWSHLLGVPFLTALFFAAHPVHTESVTWIKNRSDVLASFFFLLSFFLFILHTRVRPGERRPGIYLGSLAFCMGAIFSKAMALTLPLILVFYVLYWLPREKRGMTIIKILPFFGCAAFYFIFKKMALGMPISGGEASPLAFYPHLLTVIGTYGYYLKLLFLPVHLSAEHLFRVPGSLFETAPLLSAAALAVLGIVLIERVSREKLVSFGALWLLITFLPASNILLISGRMIAEQRLYIPSIGFCILIASVLVRISHMAYKPVPGRFFRTAAGVIVLSILLFYSVATIGRNRDWRDALTFWEITVQRSPHSFRAYTNLGHARDEAGKNTEAIESYKKAIEINPRYALALANLGAAYNDIGRHEDALISCKKAVEINPRFADAYNNLGNAYHGLGRTEEAIDAFQRAIELNPRRAEAYSNMGKALSDEGRDEEAVLMLQKAIAIEPDYAKAHYNLGVISYGRGEFQEALLAFKRAVAYDPQYAKAYDNLGLTHYRLDHFKEAVASYKRAIEIDPFDGPAHNNLAICYHRLGEYAPALQQHDRAKELGVENPVLQEALAPYRDGAHKGSAPPEGDHGE